MKKARLTTVLSLTGVLVAGSAAALVNTEVLGNPTPRTAIASEITAGLPDDTAAPVSPSSSIASIDTEVTQETSGTADTVAGASRTDYRIGDAGEVTVEVNGDVLRLVSADAEPGWTVTGTDQVDPLNVKVTIQSLASTVVFHANLLFGEVTTAVEAFDNTSSSNSTPSGNSSPSVSTPSGNSTPSGSTTPTTTHTTPSTGGGQVGGGGGGDPTPVTTGITTHTTSPGTTSTSVDDHGGGSNGGGGKGGDDQTDD